MSNTQIIDMSLLPAPQVVQVPDFETILGTLKADLVAAWPDAEAVLQLESEPLTKWLQRLAYQLVIERSARNDSAHAVMLAYAQGSDLDNLGAFFGVERLVITPANPEAIPPVAALMEGDAALRERIQYAPRGYSVAGPAASYVFHARSASGEVLDAAATSPTPGSVVVSVLSRTGNGAASQALLDTVYSAVSAEGIRPLTDEVTVQSAGIVPFVIHATIYLLPGPDASTVLATIQQRTQAYAEAIHRIGRSPTLSGIYAALHIDGVQRVELASPTADIAVDDTQAPYCTAITINDGGTA